MDIFIFVAMKVLLSFFILLSYSAIGQNDFKQFRKMNTLYKNIETLSSEKAVSSLRKQKEILLEIEKKYPDSIEYLTSQLSLNYCIFYSYLLPNIDSLNVYADQLMLSQTNKSSINSTMTLALCYHTLEEYSRSVQYGLAGLTIAEEMSDFKAQKSLASLLSNYYEKTNNYEQAFIYHEKYTRAKDTLYFMEKEDSIATLESHLDLMMQQQENNCLQEELTKSQTIHEKNEAIKNRDQRIQQFLGTSIAGSLIISLFIIATLFFIAQVRKKQLVINKKLLEKQQYQQKYLTQELDFLKSRLIKESEQAEKLRQQFINNTDSTKSKQWIQQLHKNKNWQDFTSNFNQTYSGLLDKLQKDYPKLTTVDSRLIILTKLGLDNQKISDLLAVSYSAVSKAKMRLRNRLGIQKSSELRSFIDQYLAQTCS